MKKNNLKAKPSAPRLSRTHKPEGIDLAEWQRALRKQYGVQINYTLKNTGVHPIFSEFLAANPDTGKSYKIAIRGERPGENYCSCPDFAINNLGTCKHIEFTLSRLLRKRGARRALLEGFSPPYSEVYLSYGMKREARFKAGKDAPRELLDLADKFFDRDGALREDHILDFHRFLENLPRNTGHEVRCYDDVMGYIAEHQDEAHRRKLVRDSLGHGIESPILDKVLKTELYPYQKEGAMFAVNAGRCLLGDDMGLGKTIQALAASELMAELFQIQKVLIVSPTSLKYQWKDEIQRFTGRTVEVIEGLNHRRRSLYTSESFYKLVNYELVRRDIDLINEWAPDLIILDEAQRIKNWETRTAKSVKQLASPYAMVLTGTPIENRIEDLHSLMEFVDRRRLGPLYRFVHDHRMMDEAGKVVGYKDLQSIRASLKGVLIRRRKGDVLKQLPGRIDKNFFVPMTNEQRIIHDENCDIVTRLAAKWRRYKFLCEADQRRLQIALNFMRMASDNTYLVDRKTVHGPKLEELDIVLKETVVEGGQKVVIFSQWLRMTELVERVLAANNIGYAHLNGSIPSRERKDLMARFREDPDCKVFLSTDAGGVGLNLQSASTVINMDIPWNPAILEQRIGRAHRLGQKRTVQVINFITSSSIEERILHLLKFKKSVFAGSLDEDGEDVVMAGESQLAKLMKGVEAMTQDLERPDPETERQEKFEAEQDAKAVETGDKAIQGEQMGGEPEGSQPRVSGKKPESLEDLFLAGARLLSDLGRAMSGDGATLKASVESLVRRDEKDGKDYLRIPLPEADIVKNLFSSLGDLVADAMQGKKRG
ncbi:MAG: DEAD/DEAH box helicase [Nitrospinae bacterium]|nr:DEAD/DEAH box helicase [Nitrospinota bacterium]